MLLCRLKKFPSSNFQHLLLRETILTNSDFVSQAVSDLLRSHLIEELACKLDIINPLQFLLIISLSSCVGSVARIMTRFLFLVVKSARSRESEVFLSDDFLSEISFWKNNVVSFNSKVCWSVHSLPSFSDASNSACGAFVKNSNLVFYQKWFPVERAQSSTWRELKAVCIALII